ncbi:uncharacterized protein LOC134239973 [Saccostrea cucullata]|uniref:uncharacterized protein LOC134239973 n=1 Tax=Saccostrea cuccullata TaxID=36930 RepID=UPI002ED1977B
MEDNTRESKIHIGHEEENEDSNSEETNEKNDHLKEDKEISSDQDEKKVFKDEGYSKDSSDEDSSGSYDEKWNSSDDNVDKQRKGDIQDHPTIKDKIYDCETFAGFRISEAYEGDKIKQGQRVVQNPEVLRNNSSTKRRNCIGTVVHTEDNKVLVLWDSEDDPEEYNVQDTTGETVQYNLQLFDNAQTGAKHEAHECDNCREYPIRGIKWRCLYCKDYDLCTRCYMQDKHNINHPFHRKLDNNSRTIEVGVRGMDSKDNSHKSVCGIFPGAKVVLRRDNNIKGTVEELNNEESSLFNCDAFVNWDDTKSEERYKVGRKGKVDLKCVTPGKGLKYYEEHLEIITSENAKPGMRVVAKYRKGKKEQYVGTVISNETGKDSKFLVQWDGDGKIKEIGKKKTIFLYDNSQTGIEHSNIRCDECARRMKGVRWKCESKNYDLCSRCYMSGRGEMKLKFCRMVDPSKREKLNQPRSALSSENKIQALGLFEGATVCKIESSNETRQGTISRITDYKVNTGRSVVSVKWDSNDFPKSGWKFTDLKLLESFPSLSFYPAHLPKLQNDMHGYIKAGDDKTKISVDFWLNENEAHIKQEKVLPYLLFASNPYKDVESEQEDNEEKIMQDRSKLLRIIRSVSEKSGLPCLDIVEKTMFFQDKVIIHQRTTKETIQMLIKMGEYAFERGDSKYKENEIKYFKRMTEAYSGHVVLPVALSLDNGGFQQEIVAYAVDMKFPILSSRVSVTILKMLSQC